MEKLKCGCEVSEGKFIIGKECADRNCGECKLISSIHPFARDRIVDLMFNLKKE